MINTAFKPLLLGLAGLTFTACAAIGGKPTLKNPPAHHAAHGFRNVYADRGQRGFGSILRWQLGLAPRETPPVPPGEVPAFVPPVQTPDLALIRRPDPNKVQVTWIGHSSFLIQVQGLNILTDPVFSSWISPVPFFGPKRRSPPGIRFEDLPPIDAVIISHNHFDHLDKPAIKKLGSGPRYFVPLGMRSWLGGLGIERISELDWWQTSFIGGVLFHCVPAQHFSGRGPFSFNRALWCGWVIDARPGKVYFAGDTGYSPHFKEIAARRGPIRLSLLPIGAYRPRWIMQTMHMDPADAMQAHRDLGSTLSIGMHWGTFKQTDEPLAEPPVYLHKVIRDANIDPGAFLVMKLGQTLVLAGR
jgi:N-acyl-phosphatidylethanolamine-hydrolysing phospholipase D